MSNKKELYHRVMELIKDSKVEVIAPKYIPELKDLKPIKPMSITTSAIEEERHDDILIFPRLPTSLVIVKGKSRNS